MLFGFDFSLMDRAVRGGGSGEEHRSITEELARYGLRRPQPSARIHFVELGQRGNGNL
jgi:hypothetical protein